MLLVYVTGSVSAALISQTLIRMARPYLHQM
jgi:hypothetical protein